jgi:hypothetical protein
MKEVPRHEEITFMVAILLDWKIATIGAKERVKP